MKKFISILFLIAVSPLLVVIFLCWSIGYICVMPFEKYRYKRSPFYQQTKLKYRLLAMTNEVLRTYHTVLKLRLPIEVCKSDQDYVYLKDNQGMVYFFPDTTTLIYKNHELFIRSTNKTLIPFELGIEAELNSYNIKDLNEVTLLIHKDSISDIESFNTAYQSRFTYHIYQTTKDIIDFLSKDRPIDSVQMRMALPNKPYLLYFAFIELLMISAAIYFLNYPIARISNGDIIFVLLLTTPTMIIHVLSTGLFKSIKKKFPKFIDTPGDFLFGVMVVIACVVWL